MRDNARKQENRGFIANNSVLEGKQNKLGGIIGKPVLSLKSKKNDFLIIEVSSFQLSHSKYICRDYAILLNISNANFIFALLN